MAKFAENNIEELKSKIQVLELENEYLSERTEEIFLLYKAFTDIKEGNFEKKLIYEVLESISVLVDIQFSALFDKTKDGYKCVGSYALLNSFEPNNIKLTLPRHVIEEVEKNGVCYSGCEKPFLEFSDVEKKFVATKLLVIACESSVYKNRLYVFANDDGAEALKAKTELLVKVVCILNNRLEKFYFQQRLKEVNNTLKEKNEELNRKNLELEQTMQKLSSTQTQLIEAEKMASLGVLTAGVAHEINNPLNYIMCGYVGIKDVCETLELENAEQVQLLLNCIKTGVDRASDIVKSLNVFSRSKGDLNEHCDLYRIVDNCLLMLNNQFKFKILIEKEYLSKDVVVKGNAGKLHQAFLNVLNNARQSISENGLIRITVQKLENEISVQVSDNGAGIKKEHLPKVIEPFFTTKEPGKGTGLGLSITYRIVQEHGGQLIVDSEYNKGTTVIIKIPINHE